MAAGRPALPLAAVNERTKSRGHTYSGPSTHWHEVEKDIGSSGWQLLDKFKAKVVLSTDGRLFWADEYVGSSTMRDPVVSVGRRPPRRTMLAVTREIDLSRDGTSEPPDWAIPHLERELVRLHRMT
jgi:hypothetical protein